MDDQSLLVRCYNVGLGDCIYLRVPDEKRAKHILIDCGNKYGEAQALREAIGDLETRLPLVEGKRTLDLLVATHAHEDHVRGFDPELFENIRIRRIWLSAAMDPEHPQAEGTRKLVGFAERELMRLSRSENRGLAAWASETLAISKAEGMTGLREDLPKQNGIKPHYVHAGTPKSQLKLFDGDDEEVSLRVLAPMNDIDGYYLGQLLDDVEGMQAMRGAGPASGSGGEARPAPKARPRNVSREDFDRLQKSLSEGALAFVQASGTLVNNTSVVLLLTWWGRRLLFVGDAEVKTAYGGALKKDKTNGSWNVMWEKQKEALSKPVDFLKVGHHGSHNATPWTAHPYEEKPHPINDILDALLPPVPEGEDKPERYAVVSTQRTNGYPTIPDPSLMEELGRRVKNVYPYRESPLKGHGVVARRFQPQRTDLDAQPWVDLVFKAE